MQGNLIICHLIYIYNGCFNCYYSYFKHQTPKNYILRDLCLKKCMLYALKKLIMLIQDLFSTTK